MKDRIYKRLNNALTAQDADCIQHWLGVLLISFSFFVITSSPTTWAAASGDFSQTDWPGDIPANAAECTIAGGSWVGAECVALHPGNQSGWNTYSAKDADLPVVNSGADLQLGPVLDLATHSSAQDFALAGNVSRIHQSTSDFSTGATISDVIVTSQRVMLKIVSQTPEWSANIGWNTPKVGFRSAPAFGDLDNDGDMDVLIGRKNGYSQGYENTSSGINPIWSINNDWNTTWDVLWGYSIPTLADVDSDGDLDLAMGSRVGFSYGFKNTADDASPSWSLQGTWTPDIGLHSAPGFADLNGDGLIDLLIGETNGISYGYENTGSDTLPVWSPNSAWDTPDVGINAAPVFADLNADGLIDLLIGAADGISYGYENTGSNTLPVWIPNSAWDTPDVGTNAVPAFADLDGDGDHDLLIGSGSGLSYGYENTGFTTYVLSGTLTSSVIDTGVHSGFDTLEYTATIPAGTTLTFDVGSGNTAIPDASWVWQTGVVNGDDISALGSNRYFQYQANLATTDSTESPVLDEVTIRYFNYPFAAKAFATDDGRVRLETDFTPSTLSSVAGTLLRNISLSGNYLYGNIFDGDNGFLSALRVYDVSDSTVPPVYRTATTLGFAEFSVISDVVVSGNYAYVAATGTLDGQVDAGLGLVIVDINNPLSPVRRGIYDAPGGGCRVYVQGTIAYLYDGDLQIIDVSDPDSLAFLGGHVTPGNACGGIYAVGNYVYLTEGAGGVLIFDVTEPTSPDLVHTIAGTASDVFIKDHYAYVVGSGLKIYDVTDPAAPVPVLPVSLDITTGSKVRVADRYAYVVENGVLKMLDVSDPTAPKLEVNYESGLSDVEVVNDLVYAGASAVKIISPGSYLSPARFISSVIDVDEHLGFTTLDYTASIPVDTTMTVDVRSGSTPVPDGSWSAWVTGIANGGSIAAVPTHRYVQYRANMTTIDPLVSPTLDDITIHFSRYALSRTLISSPYNTIDANNLLDSIHWTETLPADTDIRLQVRTAPENAGAPGVWSAWVGPDSSSNSYWNSANTTNGGCTGIGTISCEPAAAVRDLLNDQWLQYKIEAVTASPNNTPTFSDITLSYATGTSAAGFVTITPTSGLTTTEASSGSATFSVVLDSAPTADVIIKLYSEDLTEGTISPIELTFNGLDWNIPRSVTVTGQDDFVDDGDIAYTVITGTAISTDQAFDDINPVDVSLTNIDDDTAGITINAGDGLLTSEEETTDTFTIVLDSEPLFNVAIDVFSSDDTETIAEPVTLTFTAANWNVVQTVTVTGLDDLAVDGNDDHTIILAVAVSDDGIYSGMNGDDPAVTNNDNDVADIIVTPAGLVTSEAGGFATFTVKLTAKPASNVSFSMSSSDPTEGTISYFSSNYTFTPSEWNTAKTGTIFGVNDGVVDGTVPYTMDASPFSSPDGAWNGVTPTIVTPVSNLDDDGYAITVMTGRTSSLLDLETTEDGGSLTFTIRLTSAPTANVTVPISSSNPAEGVVDLASITFTPDDVIRDGRQFTVTGIDDRIFDNDQPYIITIGAAVSDDLNFNGKTPADITLTNLDNEAMQESIIESDVASANFGHAMSTGDINQDGVQDLIVGAYTDAGIGKVRVYYGTSSGYSTTPDWTAHGANAGDQFGVSVAAADVNNDGYYDVIIGANFADNGEVDEGRVYVYYGSISGLPDADADDIALVSDASWIAESDVGSGYFGRAVASAGDVNQDGNDDIIIGAYNIGNGQAGEGRVYVYHGSAGGLPYTNCAAMGDGIAHPCEANWAAESDQASAQFGVSVAGAGDVNGDTYDDIIVGAQSYGNGQPTEGRAFVYHGSASGLPYTDCAALGDSVAHPCEAAWMAESDSANAYFGSSVASAGDVNGDGYGDVIIGAFYQTNGQTNEGKAYVFHGALTTGLPDADFDKLAHPGDANWQVESNSASSAFGLDVASAGDFDGDGISDVMIGARDYNNGTATSGAAFIYFGSNPEGLATTAAWQHIADRIGIDNYGETVTSVGDLNGDGLDDFAVGANLYDNGQVDEGGVYLYMSEAPSIVVSPSVGLETSESGGSATFTVRLGVPPTDDVTVGLSSNMPTEGTVSPASLTFTTLDWMTPQIVTVTGVNDAATDGNPLYSIITTPAGSADPGYDTLDAEDVSVTNIDNDIPQTVTVVSDGNLDENGSSGFTFTRSGEITADLTVLYSIGGTAVEGADYPSLGNGVIIPTGSASVSVTLQPIDDYIIESDEIVTMTLNTSADYYIGASNSATATILDNDIASIIVTNTTGGITTELGGTSSFTARLSSKPGPDVVIDFTSDDITEGVIFPSSLTFTSANWSTPQTITVTGQSDGIVDTDISYTISSIINTADTDYSGITPPVVSMVNLDDGSRATVSLTASAASVSEAASGQGLFTLTRTGRTIEPLNVFFSLVGSAQEGIDYAAVGNASTIPAGEGSAQVLITPIQDVIAEGDETVVLTLVNATDYLAAFPVSATVSILDDDSPVLPTASFALDQQMGEGGSFTVSVELNRAANSYPVTIPYTIGGTATNPDDHDVVAGSIVINSGLTGSTSLFNVVADGESESDETIVFTMGSPVNALPGIRTAHSVTITEFNIKPAVILVSHQAVSARRLIVTGDGLVTVTATVADVNPADTHSYDWIMSNNNLTNIPEVSSDDPATFVFDPALLAAGYYAVRVNVTDSGAGALNTQVELILEVVTSAPTLSVSLDSDGDNVMDADESFDDSDNDGIPDYLDAATIVGNELQIQPGVAGSYMMRTEPGLTLQLGETAFAAGADSAQVSIADIAAYGGGEGQSGAASATDSVPNTGGYFDFEIAGLPVAGQSVRIVIPQLAALPVNAVYRKYDPAAGFGWRDYVTDAHNALSSAAGVPGKCPLPGSSAYTPGLNSGHYCVQLTIQDGGPNDIDGLTNYLIQDPGQFGEIVSAIDDNEDSNDNNDGGSGSGSSGGGGILGVGTLVLIVVLLISPVIYRRRLMVAPIASVSLVVIMWPQPGQAEFVLDFTPDTATGEMSRDIYRGSGGLTSTAAYTPFLLNEGNKQHGGAPEGPEVVVDPETGLSYLHIIMGDAAEGFIQEVYVQVTGSQSYGSWAVNFVGVPAIAPRGAYGGDVGSAGAANEAGNSANPLHSNANFTGNGSANPTKVIMRQIVSDGEIHMEFLKDKFDRKPAIVQVLNAPGINATSVIDMRNSTYSDMNVPGMVFHTMELNGVEAQDKIAKFDNAKFNTLTDSEEGKADVTAGRFTYTAGAGQGGSVGTYEYLDGAGFDPSTADWASYFDMADPTNVWTHPANIPQ